MAKMISECCWPAVSPAFGRSALPQRCHGRERSVPASLAQQLPVANPGPQAVLETLQPEELVGGVIILVGGGEGKEYRLRAQRLAEDQPDRDRRPHAHPQSRNAIDLMEHAL